MTITYVNLVGSFEAFDKTIDNLFSTNWTAANTNGVTPKFSSATGTNVTHSWPSNTRFGTNQIHCNEEEAFIDASRKALTDSHESMITLVYIDVFATDANRLKLFIKEINRILYQANPGIINKSDGSASAIAEFDPQSIDFRIVSDESANEKQIAHAAGVLKIKWSKIKS